MNTILLLLLSLFWLSPTESEGDLKLRIATFGYEDVEDGSGDRRETILRSIETQITPGKKFAASCRNGAEIIELRGSCTQDEPSNFTISVHYRYIKIPAEAMKAMHRNGGELPDFLPGTAIQSVVSLKPGESATLGGLTRVAESKAGDTKKSSAYRIVVTLVDNDAAKQKSAESGEQLKPR